METEIWKQFRNALWESNTFFTLKLPLPSCFSFVCRVSTKKKSNQKVELFKKGTDDETTRSWNLKLKKNSMERNVEVVRPMKLLEGKREGDGEKRLFEKIVFRFIPSKWG